MTPLMNLIPLLHGSFAAFLVLNNFFLSVHIYLFSDSLLPLELVSLTYRSFADHATGVGLYVVVVPGNVVVF